MMKIELIDITDEYDHQGVETFLYDIFVPEMSRFVGRCEFRNETGRDLRFYGNIGYVIYPPYRGKNLAYQATLALFDILAIKKPDVHEVILTCNPDNIASQKIIRRLSGTYVETVNVDTDHELYHMGETQKEIYTVKL